MLLAQFKRLFSAQQLDTANADEQLAMASAALLIEVARADFDSDPREQAQMLEHIKTVLSVSEEAIVVLTARAEQEVDEATSLYEFTRVINDSCDPQQRIALVEAMWEVAYADGELHKYEEHIIRRTAELLYVAHSDFILSKHRVQARIASAT